MIPKSTVLGLRQLAVRLGISFAVAIGAGAALLFVAGGENVFDAFSTLSWTQTWVLVCLSLVNYLTRSLRWHLLCKALGLGVPVHRSILYYVAGLSMVFSPGKVGEVVRLWFLRQGHGLPFERTAALLVADRVCDVLALVLLLSITIGTLAEVAWIAPTLGILGVIVGLAVIHPSRLPIRTVELGYRLSGVKPRWFVWLRKAVSEFENLARARAYYPALLLSLVGWLAEAYALWLLMAALGFPITVPDAVLVFSGSMLIGAATLVPGGLGGTEASLAGLLTVLGCGSAVALAATLIFRAATLWFAFVVGAAVLPLATLLALRSRTR